MPKKVTTSEDADDEASEEDKNEALELKLKLNLLSQTQSADEAATETEDDVEKWSRIGEELRSIADRFGGPVDPVEDQELANPFRVTDLLSLLNLIVPCYLPHSLWSALLSYAAFKMFKKFQ